jgi:dipeptidyl aminopeptidase/acylaminoacyl peptidase
VSGRDLRAELLQAEPPGAFDAEARAYRVAAHAFAEREPVPRRRRHTRRLALGIAVLALIAAALSPPGSAVLDRIRDAVGRERVVGVEQSRPLLLRLPAPGRVLVDSSSGPWVVNRDGTKRLLDGYGAASWSPGGLYVVATRGRELVALTPEGVVRWTIPRRATVRLPRWAPSGFRIAYLAGPDLRVTVANGTGDRVLARGVPRVAPAWRPGEEHVLAYAGRNGVLRVVNTDTGETLFRSGAGPLPVALAWTAEGRTLVALDRNAVRFFTGDRPPRRVPLGGRTGVALAAAPTGRAVAVVARDAAGRGSELLTLGGGLRRLFAGAGAFTDVAWSPDGEWLLVGWRSADQWVFVRSNGVERLQAVSNIANQFAGRAGAAPRFPSLGGWCCVPEAP